MGTTIILDHEIVAQAASVLLSKPLGQGPVFSVKSRDAQYGEMTLSDDALQMLRDAGVL